MIIRSLLFLSALCASASAQEFPERPITIVEPLAAGGGVDVMMRLFAEAAGRELGQRVIVLNRSGSGGTIAAVSVKSSEPDGYTLFHANNGTQAILPSMQPVPYDPVADFQPITNLFTFAPYLVVPASLPVQNASELAQLARTTPGGLRFSSPGVGSSVHLLGVMWDKSSDVPFRHVPYRGNSEAIVDLMAGRLDFTFSGLSTVRDHISTGKLRVLAIAGKQREDPAIPTMAEAGFPGIDGDTWFGLAAPVGTPKSIVDKLYSAFAKAAADPAVKARAEDIGYRLTTSTPEEFRQLWIADKERWQAIVKSVASKLN